MAIETTDYLLRCSAGSVSDSSMAKISSLLRVIAELEDMCARGYRPVRLAERRHRTKRQARKSAGAGTRFGVRPESRRQPQT